MENTLFVLGMLGCLLLVAAATRIAARELCNRFLKMKAVGVKTTQGRRDYDSKGEATS